MQSATRVHDGTSATTRSRFGCLGERFRFRETSYGRWYVWSLWRRRSDAPSHESSAEGSVVGSSSRPYTPAGHGANVDPYYQHRRMSMPDPSGASANGAGKVFSYMAPGEEGGMLSSSSSGMSSHNYGSHYFGGGYNGSASKKRPRRRYDEIERLYPCSWLGCTKSYGTLNHLNAHVAMQKHGPKRSPASSRICARRGASRRRKKSNVGNPARFR